MAVKTQTFHIATCDVCRAEFDATGDYRGWDDTPELALAQIGQAPDTHWVVTDDQKVVCPVSDPAHNEARGGESPALLQPSRDAMRAQHAA